MSSATSSAYCLLVSEYGGSGRYAGVSYVNGRTFPSFTSTGVVGAIGSILGEAGVNIAAMQVARREAGGEALMALTVDGAVGAEILTQAADAIGAVAASAADLRDE